MQVKLEPLLALSRRLEEVQDQLMEESREVARVFQNLGQLSGMDEVERQLQSLRGALERASWSAYQGAQCAAGAAERYTACERRILNAYEDAVVYHRRADSGVVDLTEIQSILKW